jgi:endogenous inhibitor of DNA gyrase (YacG/DUF329 family)
VHISCPICKRELDVPDDYPSRPFCSPNCKKVDLGNWLNGSYRLPRPLEAEDFDDLEAIEALAEGMSAARRTSH